MFCCVYFRDIVPPIIFSFLLGQEEKKKLSTDENVTAFLSTSLSHSKDKDVDLSVG